VVSAKREGTTRKRASEELSFSLSMVYKRNMKLRLSSLLEVYKTNTKRRLLYTALVLFFGFGLLGAGGGSVDTNSFSYKDGYSAGYTVSGPSGVSESEACNWDKYFSSSKDNKNDFLAGCAKGYRDGQ